MGWSRTRIDDLDGTPARPYTLGVDGKAYVLDLGERNRKRVEDLLRPFLVVAQEYGELPVPPKDSVAVDDSPAPVRKTPAKPAAAAEKKVAAANGRPTSKRTRAALANAQSPAKASTSRRRPSRNHADGRPRDLASVRAWARSNGYSVQDTGRIPNFVLDAYDTKTPANA